MKHANLILIVLSVIFFITGCTKTENVKKMTDDTYIIEVFNTSVEKNTIIIKTSLTPEKTFTISPNTKKEIPVRAAAGEYVRFKVSKVNGAGYRILDSKGIPIANYESLPQPVDNFIELDFIAFGVDDQEKDFLKYKTGRAKILANHLVDKPYKLRERYQIENGVKTSDANIQPLCSFDDEYTFLPYRGEFGNFNPQRLILSIVIDKSKSSCTYGAGIVVPTYGVAAFINESDVVSFPIWDRVAVDGHPSQMIFEQLSIESVNADGTITLFRMVDNAKEFFVYKPA